MLPKQANRKLTQKQIKKLEDLLQSELESLIFKGVYLSEDFNLSDEDRSDDVDLANAAVSNASRLRFRNREVFYAKKIQQALKRIEKNEYGECIECGLNIGFRRLQARPTAEQCIVCKEENEKAESNNVFGKRSKSFDISLGNTATT